MGRGGRRGRWRCGGGESGGGRRRGKEVNEARGDAYLVLVLIRHGQDLEQ